MESAKADKNASHGGKNVGIVRIWAHPWKFYRSHSETFTIDSLVLSLETVVGSNACLNPARYASSETPSASTSRRADDSLSGAACVGCDSTAPEPWKLDGLGVNS